MPSTSSTKIIEMIENHDYDNFCIVINEPTFDPNGGSRYRNYLSTAVYLNNFICFKKLINHPKYDGQDHDNFVKKILHRVSKCDNDNNRMYLHELIKINFKFGYYDFRDLIDSPLYYELFNITNGEYAALLIDFFDNSPEIDDFLLKYLVTNNRDVITKELLDKTVLQRALNTGNIYLLDKLVKEGFDVLTIHGKSSIAFIIEKNIKNLNKVIDFYVELNPQYNKNLISELFPYEYTDRSIDKLIDFHNDRLYINMGTLLINIMNNYDKIKGFYKDICDRNNCNLVILILDFRIFLEMSRRYIYGNANKLTNKLKDDAEKIIDFLIQQKISIPLPRWIISKYNRSILTKEVPLSYPYTSETEKTIKAITRSYFLKFYAYGFKPDEETQKLFRTIFHIKDIDNMDKLIEEIIIKPVLKKTVKKSSKKKEIEL
jgi:hypothetical protein